MLLRCSALACALTVSLVNGAYVNSGSYDSSPSSDYASSPSSDYDSSPSSDYASSPSTGYAKSPAGYANNNEGYTSSKSQVVSIFAASQTSIVQYGPIFEKSLKSNNQKDVISGLADIRVSILSLSAHVNLGVGIWIGADLNIFANLYISLLAKIQVVLKVIQAHGQIDACSSSIVALTVPLKAVVSVCINAGINVGAMIGAQIDPSFFASVGITLDISASANVGVGAGALANVGIGANANVGAAANAKVGAGSKSQVVSIFAASQTSVAKYGPIFENSLKSNNNKAVISGLADIRVSILSLSAHVNVGVGIWAGADLKVFANLYVSLLAKIQVVLQVIQAHGQIDACSSSIVALTVPLKAVVSVCINAGINVGAMIGAQVDLSFLASVGISLGISANVNAGVGVSAMANVGVGAGVGSFF